MDSRLDLAAAGLADRVRELDDQALRRAATAVCELAAERRPVEDPRFAAALTAVREQRLADAGIRHDVEALVDELDRVQFDLRDAFEAGTATDADYEAAFERARAAHALFFALDEDPRAAALESAYEAHAATGEDTALLRRTIETAIAAG